MPNFIGLDISLNSTAIYVESPTGSAIISITNKKDNNIYIKELDRIGVKFIHLNREKIEDYSANEIKKIKHFETVSNIVLENIKNYIDQSQKTYCQIEGYSFSKNTSSILDIVSLSTLIRSKLLNGIDYLDMTIISPSTLKLEACKLAYTPRDIGKKKPKLVWTNNEGVSGGSFKKPHMYKALLDSEVDVSIKPFLLEYRHLIDRDKIPNPIEDIIDAIFACKSKIKEIELKLK